MAIRETSGSRTTSPRRTTSRRSGASESRRSCTSGTAALDPSRWRRAGGRQSRPYLVSVLFRNCGGTRTRCRPACKRTARCGSWPTPGPGSCSGCPRLRTRRRRAARRWTWGCPAWTSPGRGARSISTQASCRRVRPRTWSCSTGPGRARTTNWRRPSGRKWRPHPTAGQTCPSALPARRPCGPNCWPGTGFADWSTEWNCLLVASLRGIEMGKAPGEGSRRRWATTRQRSLQCKRTRPAGWFDKISLCDFFSRGGSAWSEDPASEWPAGFQMSRQNVFKFSNHKTDADCNATDTWGWSKQSRLWAKQDNFTNLLWKTTIGCSFTERSI